MVVAALLVLVVIVAGVVLHKQKEVPLPANGFARLTVNSSISSAAKLFRDFERQRLRLLALQAQPLGGEPNFAAFVQNALAGHSQTPAVPSCPACPPSVDLVSIADQIEQRRMSFGSDLLILLDDNGHVIFRTDQPSVTTPTREDLYESTQMVKRIVDDATIDVATGVLALGNRLFHAAVAPVGVGANRVRVGYIVNALAIDDAFANRIAEITQAGVIFVSPTSLSRSSNAPSVGMQQMSGVEQILRGRTVPPSTVTIDRNSYIMTGEPLVSGDRTVGAAVFLRSLDQQRSTSTAAPDQERSSQLNSQDLDSFKKRVLADANVLAGIMGTLTAPSIHFNDANSTRETLSALRAQPHIIAGAVFDKDGRLFAEYHRPGSRHDEHAETAQAVSGVSATGVVATQPILFNGTRVGTVYMRSDQPEKPILADANVLAGIMGTLTAAQIAFNDVDGTRTTLSVLRALPHITTGGVFDKDGRLFAEYHRPGSRHDEHAETARAVSGMSATCVVATQPILFNGTRVGTVYLRSDRSGSNGSLQ